MAVDPVALAPIEPIGEIEPLPDRPLSVAAIDDTAGAAAFGLLLSSSGVLDRDWAPIIDATWGKSPWSVSEMLRLFDTFWNTIHQSFACFQGIDVNWLALRNRYRAEIERGVSRGRFVAIVNHAALALRESHTRPHDDYVNHYPLHPGVPLFVIGGWGDNARFGAGLTPLPDSSLLVYRVIPNHPLGLAPGDIVVGYEGVPWKEIYPQLLAAELPITGQWVGSSPSSWAHSMLMSAGLNWHLFSTIDVVKYATGDTVHLPVQPLTGLSQWVDCSEQLPVPGVPFPDYTSGRKGRIVTWGLVAGTRIGYVYARQWDKNAGTLFTNAVDSLLTYYNTAGLIFDFRTNYGGNMFLAYGGLERLFDKEVWTIGFVKRCSPGDHFAMCPTPAGPPWAYVIHGTAAADYNRPIAVLVGPGAVSSGDQVANLFRYHPKARVFGRPTAGAFNGPGPIPFGSSDWSGSFAWADAYRLSDPGNYLTHDEFPVDEPVWLTRDDVAHGHDTVAGAAIAWILAGARVAVDVRPGSDENVVNPGSRGVLPVAILSDSSLDATTLDPLSIRVAGAGVRVRPDDSPMAFWEDENGDGRMDLVLHIETDAMKLSSADTVVHLTGRTVDSLYVHGSDRVQVVGSEARRATPALAQRPGEAARAPALLGARALASGEVRVALAIAAGTPAALDLVDVAGRRVAGLALDGGDGGTREVTLGRAGLGPGIYWVRLRQADQAFTRKVVLLR